MSAAFEIPVCASCGHAAFPPHLACTRCGSLSWRREPEAAATVEQVTIVRRRVGAAPDAAPIPLASVRSALGPVLIARAEDGLRAGDQVELYLDGAAVSARRAEGASG